MNNSFLSKKMIYMMFFAFLLLTVYSFQSSYAQSFGSVEGLMQGQRVARVNTVLNDTVRADTLFTNWIPFGTFDAMDFSNKTIKNERIFAPSRFTLFVKTDTTNVKHTADPKLRIYSEIALDDTNIVYTNHDKSLNLAPSNNPLTGIEGRIFPLPVYGGGAIRFVVSSDDSLSVKLDLWRIH